MKNRFGLEGRTAIITGGGQGLGKEIAGHLCREGVNVVVADIAADDGERVVEEIHRSGGRAMFVQTDISDEGAVTRLLRRADEEYGRLDVLVNNAKAYSKHTFENVTREDWNSLMDVILLGSFFASRAAICEMKKEGGWGVLYQ